MSSSTPGQHCKPRGRKEQRGEDPCLCTGSMNVYRTVHRTMQLTVNRAMYGTVHGAALHITLPIMIALHVGLCIRLTHHTAQQTAQHTAHCTDTPHCASHCACPVLHDASHCVSRCGIGAPRHRRTVTLHCTSWGRGRSFTPEMVTSKMRRMHTRPCVYACVGMHAYSNARA